ncbi:hypothetical protein C6A37_01550 [Desulfobacteraceae bacterium SEEP-SAG9]|nr:hypothetical protein C6A37_01550 [Desulfobacteraceae bacterium SEEP-SAG9]
MFVFQRLKIDKHYFNKRLLLNLSVSPFHSFLKIPEKVPFFLTEAFYLLGFSWKAQDNLWEFIMRGGVEILSLNDSQQARF